MDLNDKNKFKRFCQRNGFADRYSAFEKTDKEFTESLRGALKQGRISQEQLSSGYLPEEYQEQYQKHQKEFFILSGLAGRKQQELKASGKLDTEIQSIEQEISTGHAGEVSEEIAQEKIAAAKKNLE